MINESKTYEVIKSIVDASSKTFIDLSELNNELKKNHLSVYNYILSSEGAVALHRVMNRLVKEQLIAPTQSAKVQRKIDNISLYSKYRKTALVANEKDNKDILTQLFKVKGIKHDYYSKHLDKFVKDKEAIEIISRFIQSDESANLSVHERSWELFGDEKFLYDPAEKAKGELLLKNLGLTLSDLKSYYTYEPFFFYQTEGCAGKENINILILENKDTYWTFQQLLKQNILKEYDMVIYGEGNKITGSLKYLEQVNNKTINRIDYFGDIDREGLDIYNRLINIYGTEYPIYLAEGLYQWLLDEVRDNELNKTKKEQNYNPASLIKLLEGLELDKKYKDRIVAILEVGNYAPQEALNYQRLCKLLGGYNGKSQ